MAKMDKNGKIEYTPEELTPPNSVDYFIYRTDVEREHKHATLWFWACVIAFGAFLATNIFWIWREMQYEDIVITQEASAEGDGDAIVNGTADGDITYYGYGEADDQGTETENGR